MPPKRVRLFDLEAFLDLTGLSTQVAAYTNGQRIYARGGACETVLCIKAGEVELPVVAKTGREATVAVLGAGEFFGEGALAGQPLRTGRATAHTDVTLIAIDRAERRSLREEHGLSDEFTTHLLTRDIPIEEDLIEQLFSSAEKRLACALLTARGPRRGEDAPAEHPADLGTDARRDGGHDATAPEPSHEPVHTTGVHQCRSGPDDSRLAPERRADPLKDRFTLGATWSTNATLSKETADDEDKH